MWNMLLNPKINYTTFLQRAYGTDHIQTYGLSLRKTEMTGGTSISLVIKNTKQGECNGMSSVGNERRFKMT